MDETNQFEKAPGSKGIGEVSGEAVERAEKWASAMAGMPERNFMDFVSTGEKISETLGNANEENEFYGEAKDEDGEEYDEGMENAQSLSGALADAVNKYGIESTIQKLNSCDLSGSTNPIGDLYYYLGIGTAYEGEETAKHEMAMDGDKSEAENPASQDQDVEGTLSAIADMKELISEVQGASPVYEKLRQGARSAGMGYFEYAVSSFGVQGLPELFKVLKEQKEQSNEVEEKQKEEEEKAEQEMAAQDGNERLNPEITRSNAN